MKRGKSTEMITKELGDNTDTIIIEGKKKIIREGLYIIFYLLKNIQGDVKKDVVL